MSTEYEATLDPRRQRAIRELTQLVRHTYPSASFSVLPAEDAPEVTHILATVDVEDPDAVVDLVIDRMLELQIDEEIPVHLIPIRTPLRTAQLRREQRALGTAPTPPVAHERGI